MVNPERTDSRHQGPPHAVQFRVTCLHRDTRTRLHLDQSRHLVAAKFYALMMAKRCQPRVR